MIRLFILILILVFVCAVYVLHAKMEENDAKSGEKIIDDMIKNKVIDEIAKGKDRG